MRRRADQGMTLIEVLAASVIGALLAAGTILALVMGVKLSRASVTSSDASAYAAQTIERNRNRIACDDAWFNSGCTYAGPGPSVEQPDAPALPTDSSLEPLPDVNRRFTMEPKDCDGVDGPGDCYLMTVLLHWDPPESMDAPGVAQ